MMALLNDVLDFEKIESGKLELELINFDLHRLLNSVITLMSGHAEVKDIDLILSLSEDTPRYVVGDPVRLRQVLLNLTGNSIKFTDKGGVKLDVSVNQENTDQSQSNNIAIVFKIIDTGIGISEAAQKNLFNPFSQADKSISRKFGGTGLGLAICQRLIEAMGDDIKIQSQEGKGSTFYFSLNMPLGSEIDEDSVASAPNEIKSARANKKLRVLIVEDNEINQKLLKEFISRMGHEIDQALSGEEAIEKFKANIYDVVLMDVQLPGISGLGATKFIRTYDDEQKSKTPVFALTGNVREEDIRACYAVNMNGHIAKPIDVQILTDQLNKVYTGDFDNPISKDITLIQSEVMLSEDSLDKELLAMQRSSDTGTADEGKSKKNSLEEQRSRNEGPQSLQEYVATMEQEKNEQPESSKSQELKESSEQVSIAGSEEIKDSGAAINQVQSFEISEEELNEDTFSTAIKEDAEKTNEDDALGVPLDQVQSFEISEEELDEDTFSSAVKESSDNSDQTEESNLQASINVNDQVEVAQVSAQSSSKENQGNIFDQEMLGGLKESLDVEQLKELLDGLFEKSDEIVVALNQAFSNQDVPTIAARSHELKGMAGNFGLTQLSLLAAETEKAAKDNQIDGIGNKIAALSGINDQSKAAIYNWLET
jgi:CheY-like chemotaxis protein